MAVDVASILGLALRAVSARALLVLALLMSGGLFAWAMWAHGWIELAIAGTFALLVFLPLLHKGDGHARQDD